MPSPLPRYVFAPDNVCGLLYRPGEMSIESLNYCRLRRGHGGKYHSTREHKHDHVGFDWLMTTEPPEVDFSWPN